MRQLGMRRTACSRRAVGGGSVFGNTKAYCSKGPDDAARRIFVASVLESHQPRAWPNEAGYATHLGRQGLTDIIDSMGSGY